MCILPEKGAATKKIVVIGKGHFGTVAPPRDSGNPSSRMRKDFNFLLKFFIFPSAFPLRFKLQKVTDSDTTHKHKKETKTYRHRSSF